MRVVTFSKNWSSEIEWKTMKLAKSILAVWGVTSAIAVISAYPLLERYLVHVFTPKFDEALDKDFQYVLDECGLDANVIHAVLNSYESRNMSARDQFRVYKLNTSEISDDELHDQDSWTRGDRLEGVKKDGVLFFSAFRVHKPNIPTWIPSEEILVSENTYVYSWMVSYHNDHVTNANLIFVVPEENVVYFVKVGT